MGAQGRPAIESQSQTLPDDAPRAEESADVIDDSDPEEQPRTEPRRTGRNFTTPDPVLQSQQITPPATKGKERPKKPDRGRRSTILEPIQEVVDDELQTFIRIVDISVEPHIELWVRSLDEFVASVTERPEDWWNNIQSVIADRETTDTMVRDQANTIQRQQVSLQARNDQLEDMRGKLAEAEGKLASVISSAKDIAHLEHEVARIRDLRDAHKKRGSRLSEQIHQLRLDKANLEKEVAGFQRQQERQRRPRYEMGEESDDDDDRQSPVRERRPRDRFAARLSPPGQGNYMGGVLGLNNPLINNYTDPMNNQPRKETYPKLNEFYGAHEDWERWRDHLRAKVEVDGFMFLNEQHKIRYAREHTRKTAYDTVKHRAAADSEDPYQTLEELILDLEQAFGKKNKMSKAIDELFSPEFRMGSNKKDETFDEFLVRFNNLAAPVKLQTEVKIKYLRDKLTERMRFRMPHLKTCTNWSDFVEGCRGVYDDNADLNNYRSVRPTRGDATRMSSNRISRPKRKHRSRSRSNEGSPNRGDRPRRPTGRAEPMNRFPEHIAKRLRREGRCFKCLKVGHLATDPKAPCKHEKGATREEALVEFAAIGVEWDGVDVEGYESESSGSDTSSSHSEN